MHPSIHEEPAFLAEVPPDAEPPYRVTLVSARQLYDLQPGETVAEAIARANSGSSSSEQ